MDENNMNKNNIKSFTTGEFAKRFGIKKDTLFYYDRIGLFHPAKVGDNDYRYYTFEQLDVFWMLQSLRELNFPIKSLKNYVNDPSPQKLIDLSKEQLTQVKEEIKKLEQIQWLLSNIVDYTEEALSAPLDEFIVKTLPDETILYSNPLPLREELNTDEWFNLTDQFLKEAELKGPAYAGSIINQKDIESGIYGRVGRLFVRRNDAKSKIKPAGLYAITYHKGPFELPKELYEPFLQKIKEQGLTICGDAYEEYLLDKLAVQDTDDFMIKISIAVY
ncbi:MerR family transcriptional regulator [Lachnoclostridium phytofermentans]|uniref:Transcriptional regulator, MerR family n=1 Tax=Lachnoclostridium phytofermentans (strain ATCC 700394 / DSM 18823 / ISDg) TaxID=357809 RepID=A9KJF0_LACP7|nr:MerR family transcriptional regulator [Lachnoclostridium phytofermentans]ABX43970.1 transcriptional regulator, MerR family [Lachnoclostridium phytofermentans ISDg]